MHAFGTVWLCIALAVAPANGERSGGRTGPSAVENRDANDALAQANAAWERGAFAEVRRLLEPLADDEATLADPQRRQAVLVLLADASLGDTSLNADERLEQARAHLEKMMDLDASWRLPKKFYSPELYDLYVELRIERAGRAGTSCEAGRIACTSDLEGARSEVDKLTTRYADLDRKFNSQEVEVRELVARNRILAAIPGGFGHFYNGEPGLGGAFLATELAIGAAGLGLLIRRNVVDGCRRTRGFQGGSLVCDLRGDADLDGSRREGLVRRRKAEEFMGWALLVAVAIDIVIAQVRFKPFKTNTVKRRPRRELDREAAGANAASGPDLPRRRTRPRGPRASLRAAPTVGPQGVGLGMDVRF